MEAIITVRKSSIRVVDTLLAIPVGKTVFCRNRVINSQVVQATISRLQKAGRGEFAVSSAKDGLLVTNLTGMKREKE